MKGQLERFEDGDLIYELIQRGYTVTRSKHKSVQSSVPTDNNIPRHFDNPAEVRQREPPSDLFSPPQRNKGKQYESPTQGVGPSFMPGAGVFSTSDQIEAKAQVGAGVLFDFVGDMIKPRKKEEVKTTVNVELPKEKTQRLSDINDLIVEDNRFKGRSKGK
jgi:hypothetical protein